MKHDDLPGRIGAGTLSPRSSSSVHPTLLADAATLLSADVPADAVRILVGLDVPAGALAEIEADWARIGEAVRAAPDLVPAMIATALGRLQQLALGVSGVAVAERSNPFARWVRAA